MPNESPTKEEGGSTSGKSLRAEEDPLNSENSTAPSSGLKKRWRTPKNVRELATQINQVATLVLNDQIDLERARAFGALTRNVAQLISTEFQRSRSKQQVVDTNFCEESLEDADT